MIGLWNRSTTLYREAWPDAAHWSTGAFPANSAMSAPAANALSPAPVTTTARTVSSASSSAREEASSSFILEFIAFSLSGRLRLRTATAPARMTEMVSNPTSSPSEIDPWYKSVTRGSWCATVDSQRQDAPGGNRQGDSGRWRWTPQPCLSGVEGVRLASRVSRSPGAGRTLYLWDRGM